VTGINGSGAPPPDDEAEFERSVGILAKAMGITVEQARERRRAAISDQARQLREAEAAKEERTRGPDARRSA
jgi:hypothetical protein